MKKIKINQKERRIIIVFMLLNSFALLVNYFGLSPKFTTNGTSYNESVGTYNYTNEIFPLTDSKTQHLMSVTSGTYYADGTSEMYKNRHPHHFWPFTKFVDKKYPAYRFRGIFADYDHTEFLVYSLLIFGIIILRKVW